MDFLPIFHQKLWHMIRQRAAVKWQALRGDVAPV